MRLAFILGILSCFCSLALWAIGDEPEAPPAIAPRIPPETALNRYTIEQMHQAVILFRAIQDRSLGLPAEMPKVKGQTIVLTCAPSVDEVRERMATLHWLWGQKLEREAERLLHSPQFQKALRKELRTCERDCQCAAYHSLLEKVEDRLSPQLKSMAAEFLAKASRQTAEKTWICAQKSKWYCDNSLLRQYLSQKDLEPEFLSDGPVRSSK